MANYPEIKPIKTRIYDGKQHQQHLVPGPVVAASPVVPSLVLHGVLSPVRPGFGTSPPRYPVSKVLRLLTRLCKGLNIRQPDIRYSDFSRPARSSDFAQAWILRRIDFRLRVSK